MYMYLDPIYDQSMNYISKKTGLDVMESQPLHVQDMFQPTAGLISYQDGDHYQLSGWGPLSHAHKMQTGG